jgi:uncharacterized protein (UPF0332 family)
MNSGFYDKAKRGINDAEMLFATERYEAAANRAYYACFHAAIALLARFGIEHKENPHAWVQAQFSAEIIHRRRIFPREMNPYLPDIRRVRHVADYSEDALSRKTATQQLKQAKHFVSSLLTYLEQNP